MIWTECPRCQGEVGNWCGGQCHEGGLYICTFCGNAEEDNSEECPCCGRVDEDMRAERLKAEAEDGNVEAAAELYAIQSGDHDKAALRQAFLAGAGFVGEPTVNADLLDALKRAVDDGCATTYANEHDEVGAAGCCGVPSYAPHSEGCWIVRARAAIAKAEGGAA